MSGMEMDSVGEVEVEVGVEADGGVAGEGEGYCS